MDGAYADRQVSRMIPGFHGVRKSLEKGAPKPREIWIAREKNSARARLIMGLAQERKVPVSFKKEKDIARLLPGVSHQGFVAISEDFVYADLNQVISSVLKKEGNKLLLALDHITDEGNLGSIIRSAAFFGAGGLILPKDRSAGVSSMVLKRSAGACLTLPVSRVVNLSRTIESLKKQGFWAIGAAGEAETSVYRFDWKRDLVLILGNEEKGLSRSVRKCCDELVGIPARGSVESLNVAVAAGSILSEITRQWSV